jgi:hypothetical protein
MKRLTKKLLEKKDRLSYDEERVLFLQGTISVFFGQI